MVANKIKNLLLISCSFFLVSCSSISGINNYARFNDSIQSGRTYYSVNDLVETNDGLIISLIGYTDSRGIGQKIIGPRFTIKNTNKTETVKTLNRFSYVLNIDGYEYTPQSYYGSYYILDGSGLYDQGIVPGSTEQVEPNFRVERLWHPSNIWETVETVVRDKREIMVRLEHPEKA